MTGITDPTEQYFKDGLWGWDGTRWRKLPLLWGYTNQCADRVQDLSAVAGDNFLFGTAVPAGQVWVVNLISGFNNTNVCPWLEVGFFINNCYYRVVKSTSPAAGASTIVSCSVVLKAGDKAYAYFSGCVSGDDLYLDILGYKMAVT